jgi:hypothetical protein
MTSHTQDAPNESKERVSLYTYKQHGMSVCPMDQCMYVCMYVWMDVSQVRTLWKDAVMTLSVV